MLITTKLVNRLDPKACTNWEPTQNLAAIKSFLKVLTVDLYISRSAQGKTTQQTLHETEVDIMRGDVVCKLGETTFYKGSRIV